MSKILKRLEQIITKMNDAHVVIGVIGGTHTDENGGTFGMAELAAVHEFGATINHPGGTRYSVGSRGARFERSNLVGPSHGTTKAHEIVIPERSFLRSSLIENKQWYQKLLASEIGKAMRGEQSIEDAYNVVGLDAAGKAQKKIEDGIDPPNADSTRLRKGSSKPLIDTGQLIQSITWNVRNGGD